MGQHVTRVSYNTNNNITWDTTIAILDAYRPATVPNGFPHASHLFSMREYKDLTKDYKENTLGLDIDQIRMLDSITFLLCKDAIDHGEDPTTFAGVADELVAPFSTNLRRKIKNAEKEGIWTVGSLQNIFSSNSYSGAHVEQTKAKPLHGDHRNGRRSIGTGTLVGESWTVLPDDNNRSYLSTSNPELRWSSHVQSHAASPFSNDDICTEDEQLHPSSGGIHHSSGDGNPRRHGQVTKQLLDNQDI